MSKYVYFFGDGASEGNTTMRNLLGGKGANLAEMANLGFPVPPGFTIPTDLCNTYYELDGDYPDGLEEQVDAAVIKMGEIRGGTYGDAENPLLISVRSGARQSMPGMMDTILNVGLTTDSIGGLIQQTGNERFAYDAYRRLITMYSDVVMEKGKEIEPEEGQSIRLQLEHLLEAKKETRGIKNDTDLTATDLKELVEDYKAKVKEVLGLSFPDDAKDQLWGAIGAVFDSWNSARAIAYRRIEGIPGEWGTAVNVQAMVFGNMGESSATGVAFTRDPATGNNIFYGEWLANAQGEDVVAGTRTPLPVNDLMKSDSDDNSETLESRHSECYAEMIEIQHKLEEHYRDMQDIEFTIENGRLWMLQCRTGKRTGAAAIKMAVDMSKEGLIDQKEALSRVSDDALVQVLLPMVDPKAEIIAELLAKGLPAGPGGANGKIVFTSDNAVIRGKEQGEKVILVRDETSPEDVHGMHAAEAVLTAKGGMTSHAALVARAWGKCCIVGCGDIEIDVVNRQMVVNGQTLKEGDWITLNGTVGNVYRGQLDLIDPDLESNQDFTELLSYADEYRRLKVRTNADTPADAKRAIDFGAEGIGLFRIEHMFYGEESDEPLFKLRKMIMSSDEEERREALANLYPHMKADIKTTLEVMSGYPVTIRLLDPPLHEFVPHENAAREELAAELEVDLSEFNRRADDLHETNPMMGHRGVRLGISFPEITETQVRAILEAAVELTQEGKETHPEIMIPVLGHVNELQNQKQIVDRVYQEVLDKYSVGKIDYMVGTMIEIPRAALTADKIAEVAEFFSFGTNDLTQMSFGFSRDDVGGFLPDYISEGVLENDPFQTVDQEGVGQLIELGIERGRTTRSDLKIGICGEHGGDAASVIYCHNINMDYVSCSPFRVPIARLAAAHAVIQDEA